MTRVRTRILMIVMVCLLCACGNKEEAGWNIQEETEDSWVVSESIKLPDDIYSKYILNGQGSLIYLYNDTDDYSVYSLNRLTYEEQRIDRIAEMRYPEGESASDPYLEAAFCDNQVESGFLTLWQLRSGEGTGKSYELIKYDSKGKVLDDVQLSALGFKEGLSNVNNILEEDGCYYLLTDQKLLSFASGKEIKETRLEDGIHYLFSLHGEPYLAGCTETKTKIYPLSDGNLGEALYEIPLSGNLFFVGASGELFLSDGDRLYRCDLENAEVTRILNWIDTGLTGNDIQFIMEASEERISFLGYRGGSRMIWMLEPSDGADERTVITLLSTNNGGAIQDKVIRFNESNEQYRIVMEDPMDGLSSDTWAGEEDMQTRIQLSLISQNPPDIVYLDMIDNWESYAKNGAFEDLAPYLDASSVLSEEDYLPSALECGKVEDKLIYIPEFFLIRVLYGQKQYLGSGMGWTLQELLELCDDHEEMSPFNGAPEMGLRILLSFSLEEFVDYSESKCDFENQLFYGVLRCANKCHFEEARSGIYYRAITDTNVLIEQTTLLQMADYLKATGAVPGYLPDSTVELAIKGFPSKDGQLRTGMLLPIGTNFAICSRSENKEGAWQFIEFLQTSGESVTNPIFSARTDILMENIRHVSQSYGFEFRECTQEDIDNLISLINGMEIQTNQDETILQIITEEAQSYFDGQKTEEEVAEIIQNRVQLYLSEMQ
ncbi:MAG: extracellular solute-binding protein [Acetatifactor sp.]|nr:extracellular solute-binding protein [Acetatifactor sp.]